ncbi:MAG: hypothetical protein IJU70_12030 [Lentisphaeria bacterium]|nr:hypothetical protein [Lentisphaeria bacterium]
MTRAKTLTSICGERWPRLLSPTLAAAYCGMLLGEFRRSPFAALIREVDGRERVDRAELDAEIDSEKTKGVQK